MIISFWTLLITVLLIILLCKYKRVMPGWLKTLFGIALFCIFIYTVSPIIIAGLIIYILLLILL